MSKRLGIPGRLQYKTSPWHLNGFPDDGFNIGGSTGRNPPFRCTLITLIAMQRHQTKTEQKYYEYIIKNRFIIIYSNNSTSTFLYAVKPKAYSLESSRSPR